MFCKSCGGAIPDGAAFCPNCGIKLETVSEQTGSLNEQPQKTEYVPVDANSQYSNSPQFRQYAQSPYQQNAELDKYKGMPMKWYKFLVFFALWAAAALNFLSGISTIQGSHYDGKASFVYRQFPLMKPLDIVYGIAYILIAALGVYTAVQLLKLKKGAPKLVIILYLVNGIAAVIYSLLSAFVLKSSATVSNITSIITSAVTTTVVTAVMVLLNKVYFDKRAHLFVN